MRDGLENRVGFFAAFDDATLPEFIKGTNRGEVYEPSVHNKRVINVDSPVVFVVVAHTI